MYRKPELLMPASCLEVLKTAFIYGADAVYIGGDMYGLRAKARNFSPAEMKEGIEFAHARGKRVYVTANITAHNGDLEGIREYFRELREIGPDALIISDPGVFEIAKEVAPELERHVSTQANNVNYGTYNFWYRQGAKRVVSARELSLEEIAGIRKNIPEDMEIESFIHGAMCISYSGRCLLSNYLTGRDANLGECTHPCRWRYYLMEETRPGEYFPVEENERGTYIFNSRDLCMIDHIPEMLEAGIDSFKVEGRMKTALYVATVARAYRHAIDTCLENPEEYKRNIELYREEIKKCTNRRFTTGFFFGKPGTESQVYDSNTYMKDYIYLGTIDGIEYAKPDDEQRQNMSSGEEEISVCRLEQKNKFCVGDSIEIMKPGGLEPVVTRVLSIRDEEGNEMQSCPHSRQRLVVTITGHAEEGNLLRVKGQE